MAGISGANEGENNTEHVKERKRDVEQNEQRVINGHGKDDVANTEKSCWADDACVKIKPKNIACVNISLFFCKLYHFVTLFNIFQQPILSTGAVI